MVATRNEDPGSGQTIEDANVKMKDGIRAWVVAFAGTLSFALNFGMYRSLGIFIVEIMDVFEATTTQSSILLSAFGMAFTITALVVSIALGEIVHERALQFMATIVGFFGYLFTFFATRIDHVTLSLGIALGTAVQITITSSSSLLTRYFERRLTVATGVVTSGLSVGIFAWPVLFRYLLNEYSFRGTSLIMGAISLNGLVCAALMKPFPGTERPKMKTRHRVTSACWIQTQIPPSTEVTFARNINDVNCSEPLHSDSSLVHSVQRTESTCTANNQVASSPGDRLQKLTCYQKLVGSVKRLTLMKQTNMKRKSSIAQIFALRLCTNPIFILYVIFHGIVTMVSDGIMQFYPSILRDVGLTDYQSAFLLSLSGLAGLLGRLITGCLGDYIRKRYKVVLIGQAVLGLAVILNQFAKTFWWHSIYALTIGLVYSIPYSFRMALMKDFFQVEHMTKMIAFSIFASGIGMIGGNLLIGWLRDFTGGYLVPMYVLASFCFLNCVILTSVIFLKSLSLWSRGRREEDVRKTT